jgi:hypothetical protein
VILPIVDGKFNQDQRSLAGSIPACTRCTGLGGGGGEILGAQYNLLLTNIHYMVGWCFDLLYDCNGNVPYVPSSAEQVDWPLSQIALRMHYIRTYEGWRWVSSFSLVRQFLFLSRGSPTCSALSLKLTSPANKTNNATPKLHWDNKLPRRHSLHWSLHTSDRHLLSGPGTAWSSHQVFAVVFSHR